MTLRTQDILHTIVVESVYSEPPSGRTGAYDRLKLRPAPGQKFPPSLFVEGNKSLVRDYPVGTRFKIQVKLMKRPSGAEYLFSSWQWDAPLLAAD